MPIDTVNQVNWRDRTTVAPTSRYATTSPPAPIAVIHASRNKSRGAQGAGPVKAADGPLRTFAEFVAEST